MTKIIPLLFVWLTSVLFAGAAEMPSPEHLETRLRDLGPAPRLFASEKDWAALPARIKSDPIDAAIYRETRLRAEKLLAGPLLEHKKIGSRRLVSARLLIGRILDLVTVARVEGDTRYAARAREELLATAALPEWSAGHYLDTAEYSFAVAIGLDWLHHSLSAADRDILATALIEKAIKPTFGPDNPSLWWLKSTNNWGQVCHGGLTAAALVVADREPALAARTLARAVRSQAGPNQAYAPDGAYPEGPSYWGYGTTYEVALISMLTHSLGTDYGLAESPGFLGSADYMTQITGPTGRLFNYADSRDQRSSSPVLHWFAAQRGQPGIAASELARLQSPAAETTSEKGTDRFNALGLWWHTAPPSKTSAAASSPTLPTRWMGRGENPIAVFRSDWKDPNATFIAIKGGRPSGVHAHMDSGGFVLESDGVRWAVDPGMQDYTAVEAAKVNLWSASQQSGRWGVFRIGPEGHNILRFDGGPQLVKGAATITDFRADGPTPGATIDLTANYSDRATTVHRKVSLLPDRRVLFEDSWTLGVTPAKVTWQWVTLAEATLEGRSVLLRQNGKTLRLRILSQAPVTIEQDDLSDPPHAYEEKNPGLRRLRFTVESPAGEKGSLVIIAEPGSVLATGTLTDPILKP
ncbi:MAG: heparinase II/III family protein [Opitutaceae bacterium]|nr:heparinase II/III family protein [Opitutaceae bacterium]